jgi:hypothetical protein
VEAIIGVVARRVVGVAAAADLVGGRVEALRKVSARAGGEGLRPAVAVAVIGPTEVRPGASGIGCGEPVEAVVGVGRGLIENRIYPLCYAASPPTDPETVVCCAPRAAGRIVSAIAEPAARMRLAVIWILQTVTCKTS